MNIVKIKKIAKRVAGFVAVAAVASIAIFPALSMRADSPRFNFLDGDQELFRGVNISKNEDVWKDPINVEAGDTFEGLIYYHNGIVDSVANNTTIKVSVPDEAAAGTAKLTASISADNAETVTDTIVDGKIYGLSGLNVTFDKSVELELVPGSVKWYPNSGKTPNTTAPLPDGQTGSELFSSRGLNIGDINGCWQYAGFVKFAVKTKAITHEAINIEKTVKKSGSSDAYGESVSILTNEKVNFKIETKNTGDVTLENVIVKDKLPSGLIAVSGSAKMIRGGVESSIDTASLVANGVTIDNMAIGESVIITFDAEPSLSIADGSTLTNEASVKSGELTDTDTANVVVSSTIVKIERSKSAYNITQAIDATEVKAKAGDQIEYTLVTKNTGNTATKLVVTDGVADVLEYSDVVSISDNGKLIVGTTSGGSGNNSVLVSYPEADIAANSRIVRKFIVQVKNPLPTNAQDAFHYDYLMFNNYGNDVSVYIEKPEVPIEKTPCLSIQKYVRNITSNETDYSEANTAYAGDMLEYKIVFKNSGNGAADYIKVWDSLPSNVSLDTTTAAILGMGGSEKSIAENITTGYVIKTLAVGEEGYIRFRVLTSSQIAAGEILKNTAYLNDDSTISDTAETVIKQKVVLASAASPALPRTGSANAIAYAMFLAVLMTGGIAFAKERIRR